MFVTPTRPLQTRYAATVRRTRLARAAAFAALIAIPGIACGNNDADVFGGAATDTGPTPTVATSADPSTSAGTTNAVVTDPTPATTPDAASTDTSADTSTASIDPTATSSVGSGATFPTGGELAVAFSFRPGSGRIDNPYIAVWVEDVDGNLVQTISLWYEAGKGDKYLPDLPQWYSASGQGSDVTMSGATRTAGDYSVAWDGTDLDGNTVTAGDYTLFVEAAREHGPHEITSSPITIGADGFTVALPADGELADVSATLGARP